MLAYSESGLLQRARMALAQMLPEHFELSDALVAAHGPVDAPDALWELRDQNTDYALILVEAKTSLTPRDVVRLRDRLSGPMPRLMRNPTVLVVSTWLSPRTRSLLEEGGYSYLDLTGNVRFRIDRPAVYIRSHGADRDPTPRRSHSPVGLQGPKARRLLRLLAETRPPYRLTALAVASGLTAGYVSKMLYALDEQALVTRNRRGVVEYVDWSGLLIAGAERYDLLRNNEASTFISPEGASALYARMRDDSSHPDAVVTGSFSAVDIAAVAAPTQLVLYVDDPQRMRKFGRLLPTDQGADVILLRPEDSAQTEGTRTIEGVRHVGLTQLVFDCLSGNGRLPEEGEAVMRWMSDHENEWRRPELPVFTG